MSAHVLLNLLNELRKIYKMRGVPSILSLFRNTIPRSLKLAIVSGKSYYCAYFVHTSSLLQTLVNFVKHRLVMANTHIRNFVQSN